MARIANVFVRILRTIQLCAAIYVSIAVLYTTNYFIVSPLRTVTSILLNRSHLSVSLFPPWSLFSFFYENASNSTAQTQIVSIPPKYSLGTSTENFVYWKSSDIVLKHGLGHTGPIAMNEDLLLSKTFSTSMRPSKIVPFFYRATGAFDSEDITITTLITSNRFKIFAQLVERYQGMPCVYS